MTTKLSERERNCLLAWRDIHRGYCLNFKGVAGRADIEAGNVRRVVRSLARKGLLEFQRGLFDECDGSVAGAGYGLTDAGADLLSQLIVADDPSDALQDEPPAVSIEGLRQAVEANLAERREST